MRKEIEKQSCLFSHHECRPIEGSGRMVQAFLNSALDEGECPVWFPGYLTAVDTTRQHPLNRRLDGPQRRCGRFGKETKCLAATGNRSTIPYLANSHSRR